MKRAPDTRWKRDALLGALPGVAWMAFMLVRGGFGAYWLGLFTLSILFATAGTYIGHRVARPLRSYLIALLVSAGLAILLRLVAPNPAAPIFWFALTAFGVFWAWYWERTEPLPKAQASAARAGRKRLLRSSPAETSDTIAPTGKISEKVIGSRRNGL